MSHKQTAKPGEEQKKIYGIRACLFVYVFLRKLTIGRRKKPTDIHIHKKKK